MIVPELLGMPFVLPRQPAPYTGPEQPCPHAQRWLGCETRHFAAGLEVRVAFGGVWKHSLTELSGGQRSLLALALVLAMLLFKPAPIYILDEVTAA